MAFLYDLLLKLLIFSALGFPLASAWYFYNQHSLHWSILLTVIVLLQLLLLTAIVLLYVYRKTLVQLHQSVLDAQEGTLTSLIEEPYGDSLLQNLLQDYNTMMKNLSAMFRTVEDCQNRVVKERNKMDAILESMPGALLAIDDDLIITNTNPQAVELFNCSREWLLGKMVFDVLKLEPQDRDSLRDAFLYKQSVMNFVIHTEVEGSERYISINLAFYSRLEAEVDAVITLQDITDYQHLIDSVYNREKLVAMGQLAAGIAHELNTPLGNILGYSQLLSQGKDDSEKQARYTGFIVDEARRCSRIVNDLLSYARRDSCSDEACDVNTLIRDLIDTFLTCRLKRQKTGIQLDLDESIPHVEISCGELDIAISNLLLNALQVLEQQKNGEIRISTRGVGTRGVEIIVEDNGPGIVTENRRRIFEPFFTTKEAGDGTGLGLSISQAMLSRRGASLNLDNSYKQGARFIMSLRGVVDDE